MMAGPKKKDRETSNLRVDESWRVAGDMEDDEAEVEEERVAGQDDFIDPSF